MPIHGNSYDLPMTQEDIDILIFKYAMKLLYKSKIPPDNNNIDFEKNHALIDAIVELSYADLRKHKRPVFLLSNLCRLLIKKADYKAFHYCFSISHKLSIFNTKNNESWYAFNLYKGVSQIGINLVELGVAKVLRSLSASSGVDLCPVDKSLGYWAIACGAIHLQDLRMAYSFSRKWLSTARKGGLPNEVFRANIVMHLLNLLYGEKGTYNEGLNHLLAKAPKEWIPVTNYFRKWTDALLSNECINTNCLLPYNEPLPLLIGLKWMGLNTEYNDSPDASFSFLCRIRQTCCNMSAFNTLSTETIQQYASHLARWELPVPLSQIEEYMRLKNAHIYSEFVLNRVIGRHRAVSLFSKSKNKSSVTISNDAIVLTMDIRRFSSLCEQYSPEEMFRIINPLFRIINERMENAGGTVLEFVGDCVVVAFNTFIDQKSEILNILSTAVNCLRHVRIHGALSLRSGLPYPKIGIGIAQGTVGIGYVGGLSRCHLTLIGNAINLSARIESETKDSPTSILVSRSCFSENDPDIWAAPEKVNFSFRDLSTRPIKNMQRVHLYGVAPLLPYQVDFVPIGFVAKSEMGVVYIDTGNADEPGIIDHHHPNCISNSACELLLSKPGLLLEHIANAEDSEIEFRPHLFPDIDCATTLFSALELMAPKNYQRCDFLKRLAKYVSDIDQGKIYDVEKIQNSLYGIFMAHQSFTLIKHNQQVSSGSDDEETVHYKLLMSGMRVIDCAAFIMSIDESTRFENVFSNYPQWFSLERSEIEKDRGLYEADFCHPKSCIITAKICFKPKNEKKEVLGLWLHNPKSIFFKFWARSNYMTSAGNPLSFLVVDWSKPGNNRYVISVDPESGSNLMGIGEVLEDREKKKRKIMNKQRPVHPIRHPADNSDPWYFGQGHGYTIIDSPRMGTILSVDEIKEIIGNW